MNENIPQRKYPRLEKYDYSSPGAYFITICTEKRKNILSRIDKNEDFAKIHNKHVGEGFPLPKLLPCGRIAHKWIDRISEKYPEISVDCMAIMPNHIHLLLSLEKKDGRGDPSPTISSAIGWLKYQITKEVNQKSDQKGNRVFQRSFYDHIVRNYDDYCEVYKYICDNPINWYFDELYEE